MQLVTGRLATMGNNQSACFVNPANTVGNQDVRINETWVYFVITNLYTRLDIIFRLIDCMVVLVFRSRLSLDETVIRPTIIFSCYTSSLSLFLTSSFLFRNVSQILFLRCTVSFLRHFLSLVHSAV